MILTCPACRTRYLVADPALGGPEGRNVRCASCGNTWFQVPEIQHGAALVATAADQEALFELPRIEPGLDAPPRPQIAAGVGALYRKRPRWVAIGWAALVLLLAVAIVGGVLARDEIVALWPPAARLYAIAGMPVEAPGAGLEIGKITPTRTPDGLVIEGELTNTGKTARDVPRLRVALRDSNLKELQFKIITSPKDRLLPGEVAHFKTAFDQPSDAATGVVVTFASG